MTQCLQEQFSRTQTQQSRILELLAPLHPILQSVPLHINIARNAILEKMPECCPCPCTDNRSSRSTAPPNRTSPQKEKGDPPVEIRKRRRIDLESQHLRAPNDLSAGRYQGQLEARDSVLKSGEIPTQSRPQSTGTFCALETSSGGKSDIDTVTRNYLRNAEPWSGNAALATRLSTISRGKAPSFILVSHSEHRTRIVRKRNFSYSFEGECLIHTEVYDMPHYTQVPAAVNGKRFIFFNDDDDDDDDDEL